MKKATKDKPKAKDTDKGKKVAKKKATAGLLVGEALRRVFGDYQVVEERAETLLDAETACKQAKADLAEAIDRLEKLLVECDLERGREVISARADVRDRSRSARKAGETVKVAKAGLKEAWGVVNDLIDEKIDGLPLMDAGRDEAA